MSSGYSWTAEQRAAINERGAELAVRAAAGSGKTAVLIERVTRAALGLAEDAAGGLRHDPGRRIGLDRILVLTFTRAAAAELRERLRQALTRESRRPAAERLVPPAVVREQLQLLARAQISTFHSFCGELVRRFGHERALSYSRVLDEDEAALLRHELATRFLDEQLGRAGAEDVRQLALAWGGPDGVGPADLSRVRFAVGLRGLLLRLLGFRRTQPDPAEWYRGRCDYPALDPERFDAAHPLLERLDAELGEWVRSALETDARLAAKLARDHPHALFIELQRRRGELLGQLTLRGGWEAARELACERLKASQGDIKYKPSLLQAYRRDIDRDDPWYGRVETEFKPVRKGLEQWQALLGQPWAEVAVRENEVRGRLDTLWRLTREFEEHYGEYKRGRNVVDYDDMQRYALQLLATELDGGGLARGSDGRILPAPLALRLRARFAMVLVDEHQDTNELQEAIVDLVTLDAPAGGGAGRPRFVVGDLKQSIYTFRLAVPRLFAATCARLDGLPDSEGRTVKLRQNFRSRPRLLGAINQVFDGLLTERLGGEDYAQSRLLAGQAVEGAGPADEQDGEFPPAELHLLASDGEPAAEDDDEDHEAAEDLSRLEQGYRQVAALLRELHGDADRPVRGEDGEWRPPEWRDMVVLMRSTAGRVESLLRACGAAGVPAHAPGRSGFYERPEVADALALLRVVDNPRQDIPLAAALSGPAVGLATAELVAVAASEEPRAPDLWDRLQRYIAGGGDETLRDRLAEFGARLDEWRDAARMESVAELLWRIYAETGLLAAVATRPGGAQRVANLYKLHDLARQAAGFERQGVGRFLRALELSQRAAGDLGEAPLLSEAEDVVRVLTVHQAKGLEFPAVLVPDLDKRFNLQDLRGDVLWHRTAGLGGRHVDWQPGCDDDAGPAPPRRADTLGRLLCRRACHRELVAEELRILYVAMTRARDRLILTGTAGAGDPAAVAVRHVGEDAGCWLDWVAAQLADGIADAAESDGAACRGSVGEWAVYLSPPVAAPAEQSAHSAGRPYSAAELELIERRLAVDDAPAGAERLPAKVSVTHLAHGAFADQELEAALQVGQPAGAVRAAEVRPRFLSEDAGAVAAPTAAEVGAATHRLLAAVDFTADQDERSVAARRDELAAGGRLDADAAARIDLGAVARLAGELGTALELRSARLYRELPVALLVPASDPGLLAPLGIASGSAGAAASGSEDQVYVQGVIDLLVVHSDRAIVVDYKTDRGATQDDLLARYRTQLEWYARAAAQLVPDCAVHWAIYGLGGAGLTGPFDYVGD